MKQNWIWIIVIILGLFILKGNVFKEFALLPIGQYNSYMVGDQCIFTTNVEPVTSSYADYTGAEAWIAIDYNGDNTHEKFGWISTYSSSGTVNGCGGDPAAQLLVNNYNSDGDDVYYYYYSPQPAAPHRIYVCSADKKTSKYFKLDQGAAVNAIVCGGDSCTNECSSGGEKQCTDTTHYKTCGNYDLDSCLDWSSASACGSSQTCSNGACINNVCNTNADTNCNNCVSLSELVAYIGLWKADPIGVGLTNLMNAIGAWKANPSCQ